MPFVVGLLLKMAPGLAGVALKAAEAVLVARYRARAARWTVVQMVVSGVALVLAVVALVFSLVD